MDRLLALCLALAGLGLVVLGVMAHAAVPPRVGLNGLGRYEGRTVCVEATVAQTRTYDSGVTRLVLADVNRSLPTFLRRAPPTAPGDLVAACGTLSRTSTGYELDVRLEEDLVVLRRTSERLLPLSELLTRPWQRIDQHVLTEGLLRGQPRVLAEPGSSRQLRVLPADPLDVLPDGPARVTGRLEYEPDRGEFRLRIETVHVHRA